MVAMTPLDINFFMRSMGLFSIFCARSRITMLAGNSSLFPFLLIGLPPYILRTSNEQIAGKAYCSFTGDQPCERISQSITFGYSPAPRFLPLHQKAAYSKTLPALPGLPVSTLFSGHDPAHLSDRAPSIHAGRADRLHAQLIYRLGLSALHPQSSQYEPSSAWAKLLDSPRMSAEARASSV